MNPYIQFYSIALQLLHDKAFIEKINNDNNFCWDKQFCDDLEYLSAFINGEPNLQRAYQSFNQQNKQQYNLKVNISRNGTQILNEHSLEGLDKLYNFLQDIDNIEQFIINNQKTMRLSAYKHISEGRDDIDSRYNLLISHTNHTFQKLKDFICYAKQNNHQVFSVVFWSP